MSWSALASDQKSPPELGSPEALWRTIPIVAWYGIPAQFATPERYKEMADAGFTMSVIPDVRPTTMKQLDCAAAAGIKIILQDQEMLSKPEVPVSEFMDHPALGMYFLRDEPGTQYFSALKTAREFLETADPKHLSWINLYPNYATTEQLQAEDYETYVRRFLSEVEPSYLNFDHYGIVYESGRPVLKPAYYANLEIISRAARAHKLPFWAFVLATAFGPHQVPTESELKFQMFNNLAYGARGIQYFTYWTPLEPDGSIVFHDGPILQDGTRTPLLDLIKAVNGEVRALTPALVGLKSAGVQQVNLDTPDVEKFAAGNGLQSITGEGKVLAGFFTDESGTPWVFFVNQDLQQPGRIKVTAAGTISEVAEVSKKDGALVSLEAGSRYGKPVFSVDLEPGDGRLFKLTQAH